MARPNKTVYTSMALLVALILSNGWWAYIVFDQRITIAYSGASIDTLQQEQRALGRILLGSLDDQSEAQLLDRLKRLEMEGFKKKDGHLVMGPISLYFEGSKMKRIEGSTGVIAGR